MVTGEQSPQPLQDGQRLTRAEFLRRWEAMPALKHAELLHGVVHMPSPVSRAHGQVVIRVAVWLDAYQAATPGTSCEADTTWLMVDEETPQPDLCLYVRPECGGQSSQAAPYSSGAPELVVEVAVSSAERDLGDKLEVYQGSGVREYVVILVQEGTIRWHRLVNGRYEPRVPGADGIHKSEVFPGLWLDDAALLRLDREGIDAVLRQGLATPEHAAFVQRLASTRRTGSA